MTTYGTIPTSLPDSSGSSFVSEAKERIKSSLGSRRPWNEMIQIHKINIPASIGEFMQRIYSNINLYRMNYAIMMLFILFMSLLWHPFSLIVFMAVMVAWSFLYILRESQELIIMGRVIDDRIVLMSLMFVTVLSLYLTNAKSDMMVGLCIGGVVVLLHGALKDPVDMFLAEENGSSSVKRGREEGVKVPLKHAASSSYSLP